MALGGENKAAARRVLIIEDDTVTRKVFSHFISLRGCAVHCAASAKEAYEHLASHTYDLIIVDAHLPDSHGAEIMRTVREDARVARMPIIAISSDDDAHNIQLLKKMGADEFVTKPISVTKLWDLLDKWLP